MKHLRKGRTLGRVKEQREALLAALAAALFLHKRIETTLAKAKEMKPFAEKLITKAKEKNPARIRLVKKRLSKEATKELFDKVAKAARKRKGGYVRIIKRGFRLSDGAQMALVELVDFPRDFEEAAKSAKKAKKAERKAENKEGKKQKKAGKSKRTNKK